MNNINSVDLEGESDKLVKAIEAITFAESNGDKPLPEDLTILTGYLDTVPSFQRLKRDPEYNTLLLLAARCLKVTKYSAGDVICKQYDRGDRCYFILSGNARVYIYLQEDKLKEIEDLHAKIQGIIISEGEHRGNRVYLNKLKGQLNQMKGLTEEDCILLDIGYGRRNIVRNSQINESSAQDEQQQQQQQLTSPQESQVPVSLSTGQLSEFKRTFERKEGTFEGYTVKRVNQLKEKDTFGEFSIAKGAQRSASVIASSEQLILAHMSLEDYSSVFDFDIKHKQRLANTLLTFFPRLDFNVANRLAYFFTENQLLRKQVLFREGDIADSIYFLEEGSVELKKDEDTNLQQQQSLSKNGLELQQQKQKELSVAILQAKQFFGYEINKNTHSNQTDNDNHREEHGDSPKNVDSVGVRWCSVSAQSSSTRVQVLKIAHMLQVDRSYPFIKVISKKASKCIIRYNERFLASQVTFNQRNNNATGNSKGKNNNNNSDKDNNYGGVDQSSESSSLSPKNVFKQNRANNINLSPQNTNPSNRASGVKLTKEFQILLEKQQQQLHSSVDSSPRKKESFFKTIIPSSPGNISPKNINIPENKQPSPGMTPTQLGLSSPQNSSPNQLRSPKGGLSEATPGISDVTDHPKGAIFEYAETFEQAKKRLRLTKMNTLKTKDQLPQFSSTSSQCNRIFKQLQNQCSTPDAADLALSPRKRQLFIDQQNQFSNEILEDLNNKQQQQQSIIFPIGFGGIEQTYTGGFTEADEVQKAIKESQQSSVAHKIVGSFSSTSSPSGSPRKRKQLFMQGKQSLIDDDFLMPEELSELYSNSSRNNFDVEGVPPSKFNGSNFTVSPTKSFKKIRDRHKNIDDKKQALQLASQESSHSNSNTSLKKEQRKTVSPMSLEDLEGESPLRKTVSKQESKNSTKQIIRTSLLRLNEVGCDDISVQKKKNRLLELSRNHQKLNINTNEGLIKLLKKQQQQAQFNKIQGVNYQDDGDDNHKDNDTIIDNHESKPYINRSRDYQIMGNSNKKEDSESMIDNENDLILGQKSTSAREQEVNPFVIEPLQQRSNSTKSPVFKRERIKLAAVGFHGLPVQTPLVFASTPQQTQQLFQKQLLIQQQQQQQQQLVSSSSVAVSGTCSRVQSPMKSIKEERLPEETSFVNEKHFIRKESEGQSQNYSQEQLEQQTGEEEEQVEDDRAPVSLATLQDDHYPQPVYPQNQLPFQKKQQKESGLQIEQQQQQQSLRKSSIPLLPLSQLETPGSKPSSSNSTTNDVLKRLPASLSASTRHSLNELFLHNQCTLKRPLNVRLPVNQHIQHISQTSRRDTHPTLPEEYQTIRLRKKDSFKNQLEEPIFQTQSNNNKTSLLQTASSLGSFQPVNNNNNTSLMQFHYPQTTTTQSSLSSSQAAIAFKQKSFSTHTIQFFSPRNDHLNIIRDLTAMTNRDGLTNNGSITTTNNNNNNNSISLFGSSRKASMLNGPSQKGKQVKGRTQLISGEFIQQAQISAGFRQRSANPIQILCLPVSNRSSKMNSPNVSLTAPSFCQVDPSPEKSIKQRQPISKFPFPILPQHANNSNTNNNTNSNINYCQVSDRIHAKNNNISNGILSNSNVGFTIPKDQFSLINNKAFSRSPIRRLS